MNLPHFTRITRLGFITAALAVAVLLTLFFFLLPQYGHLQKVIAAKEDNKEQLQATNEELTQIDQLVSNLAALSDSDKAKLAAAAPYDESLAEVLRPIDALSQRAGLVLTTLDVKPAETVADDSLTPSQTKRSQVNISVRGTYANLYAFMAMIERHIRPVDISTFSMSTIGDNVGVIGKQEQLQVNITATIYYLNQPPAQPLFPYGTDLDTSILNTPVFKSLQLLKDGTPVRPDLNPFIYRN